MSNKEAIKALKRIRDEAIENFIGEWSDYEAFDIAIKVLKEVETMNKQHMATYINALENRIRELEADRPKGEWIEEYNGNGWNDYWNYTCSNCGKKYERADSVLCGSNFCPNCGAKMNEEKEVENGHW